jgi:hypothetical protein
MAAEVIDNTSSAQPPPTAPPRPGGGRYRYELIYAGGAARAYADTAGELVAELLADPAYPTRGELDAYAARLRFAVAAQVRLQAELVAEAGLDGCTLEERAVLLGPRDVPPRVTEWGCRVPLVLVDGFYAPETELPRPVSALADVAEPPNLVWLEAGSDLELLTSLHRGGILSLHHATPDDQEA